MLQLLLIDVALCALLVAVAGCFLLWRRRRRHLQTGDRQETAAEPAGDGMAGRDTAVVPGFGEDPAEPDLAAGAPAEPERAAPPQVSVATGPAPDPDGQGTELNGARPGLNGAGPEPEGLRAQRDGQRAEPQASGAAGEAAGPDRPEAPRAAPNGRPAAGAATAGDPIGSYYDEADQAMSDYLAALGWTEEPGPRHPG
jgi:hypothetical protein